MLEDAGDAGGISTRGGTFRGLAMSTRAPGFADPARIAQQQAKTAQLTRKEILRITKDANEKTFQFYEDIRAMQPADVYNPN